MEFYRYVVKIYQSSEFGQNKLLGMKVMKYKEINNTIVNEER